MSGIAAAFFHGVCRIVTLGHRVAVAVASALGRSPRRPDPAGVDVLLTATFHSDNWIAAHIRPLAAAAVCRRVRFVATRPVPTIDKVEAIYPPAWLRRLLGNVASRLAWFTLEAIRRPADVVGGFHLLFNGLLASLLARWTGARSLYFCVGGPAEVQHGGLSSENRLFTRMRTPDPVVERRLLRAVGDFDWVVTMGTAGARYFEDQGVKSRFEIVAGGIDTRRFDPADGTKEWDLVFVGRFAPIKRPDLFVGTVASVRRQHPTVRAAMLGDGVLRPAVDAIIRELQLQDTVVVAGLRSDVERYVSRSRLFVNTSDSEGLPLSVIEAMACGVPCVVSDVGDLRDLVQDGVNGCVVAGRAPEAFAERIVPLLADPQRLAAFSRAARVASERYDIGTVSGHWERILG